MEFITINDRIGYRPASDQPLSADIGVIKQGDGTWLYEVGGWAEHARGLDEAYDIVLSHFHADHTGNLGRIRARSLYVSEETYRHVQYGTIVRGDLYIGDMHLFPLPSSHAKGCLGLEVGDTYAFVGDALYCRVRDGFYVYNAQLLRDEIAVLRALRASRLLVSHRPGMLRERDEALEELKAIYGMREGNAPEIRIPMQ